jgi:hypothetical protein
MLARDASSGDPHAIYKVGLLHRDDLYGFQQDAMAAFSWIGEAHDSGNVKVTADLGVFFMGGRGVSPCRYSISFQWVSCLRKEWEFLTMIWKGGDRAPGLVWTRCKPC